MHILITDSGVGGLSVVAYAERFVRTQGFTGPVRLTFANAAPANDYGYNSMPSRQVKLETFDRFLRNVTARFAPDMIYVACNTLSVLLPDITASVPVKGIVETGVQLILGELDPKQTPRVIPSEVEGSPAGAQDLRGMREIPRPSSRLGMTPVCIIFGTQTTIDARTYPRLLQERGVDPSRIVSQACPGLADTISEDREGTKTRGEIRKWVAAAIEKMPDRNAPIVACLACTHYGYRKDVFEAELGRAIVINPNERAVADLFATTGPSHDVEVEFVTRYALPASTVETLTYFLGEISPSTVAAMQNFVHLPDLF
jgi:glutamate racemase